MENKKTTDSRKGSGKGQYPLPKKQKPPLSRDELRYRKNKKRRMAHRIKRIFVSVLVLAVVAALGVLLAFTVFFKVESVSVKGNGIYSAATIQKTAGVQKGDNLLRINAREVAQSLRSKLPYIGTVTIERDLPSTLIITVTDTRERAAIAGNGGFILLDETGKVLDDSSAMLRENVAVVSGVKVAKAKAGSTIALTDEKKQEALLAVLKDSAEAGLDRLTTIDLKNLSDIRLQYEGRITLEVGTLTSLDKKLRRAAAAIAKENEQEKGVLDLQVEPYAYFRKASEETTAAKSAS